MSRAAASSAYGDAGDRYPVCYGDVWSVGPHVLACGDVQHSGQALLDRYGPVQGCYCDPPWGPALATAFRRRAGFPDAANYASLLNDLVAMCVRVQGDCYIEMGRAWQVDLASAVQAVGGQLTQTWQITYYRTRPALLSLLRFHHAVDAAVPDVTGMDDEDTPACCIAAMTQTGETVLDPCLGRGLTLRAAHSLGRRCLGLELHPRRLAVAISHLADTGVPARRIATL